MALQTKTFTAGSPSWNAGYRGFVLTLNIIENSISESTNTSNVSYELILSNPEKHYDFYYPFAAHIGLTLGSVDLSRDVTDLSIGRDLNGNVIDKWSHTVLSGTTNIPHSSDGTLNMSIAVSFPNIDATGYAGPYGMSISGNLTLTPINVQPATNIIFNGNKVTSVVFNGQPVSHLVYNGNRLF